MTAPSKVTRSPRAGIGPGGAYRTRKFPVSDSAPVEIVEDGTSVAGRLASLAAMLTIRPTLAIGSRVPHLPWPFGALNFAARMLRPSPGTIKATIALPNCTAQLIRADGVLPADGTRSVILYLHGGAFLACGSNTHGGMTTSLSEYADSPVLVVDYRMVPKHSVGTAVDDCYDAYVWLRRAGYEPEQIVVAGDSAGGYLGLALAERLLDDGEVPAALVAMSPLYEIDNRARAEHPNARRDAMFPPKAFDALVEIVEAAAARNGEQVYEPLDHIEPGLPRTLIHVSGSEVLISDARKAARMLCAAGVPVEVHVWPGQMHVFQIAGNLVPEAKRSLRQIGAYIREATW
ncbi:alpha/beta hydrolase [Mycolicibacterium smegmatis]|uniref:alpha/beta hydrolase n=1 Tax=Mycolicibacterium smegmatis TaxID=1772 RepID=UPI001EFB25D8|nr:alpha/beta hydrolase [Mycolicibacterium smegmatis]ULN34092.1 alpha/beta hydrolase [Mycolicibacterium smegmatis]